MIQVDISFFSLIKGHIKFEDNLFLIFSIIDNFKYLNGIKQNLVLVASESWIKGLSWVVSESV